MAAARPLDLGRCRSALRRRLRPYRRDSTVERVSVPSGVLAARIWSIVRAGSAQPASPTMRAGTPATVLLCGTGCKHDRPRRNARAMPDLDVAEDLCTGPDQHAVPHLGVAVADVLAGAAQRHVLQHRDVVLDDRRGADDEPRRVIEEDTLADPRLGVDVGLEHGGRAALQVQPEIVPAVLPQGVGEAVRLDRVEAFEIQDRLDERVQAGSRSNTAIRSAWNACEKLGSAATKSV